MQLGVDQVDLTQIGLARVARHTRAVLDRHAQMRIALDPKPGQQANAALSFGSDRVWPRLRLTAITVPAGIEVPPIALFFAERGKPPQMNRSCLGSRLASPGGPIAPTAPSHMLTASRRWARGMDMKGSASWQYDDDRKVWYIALDTRADPPFRKQILVEAILDMNNDGHLAGIEIIPDCQGAN